MKRLTFITSLVLSSAAFAHEDHHLGEDHLAYHVALYGLLALVVYKGYGWLKAKKQQRHNK